MDNHYLHIYKASAGSGKTFTLAVNFIRLLIERPDNYRHILAVTFTNKATAEMKQRILSQLYGISHGLKESVPYYEKVREATGLDENIIRERALQGLSMLVHDYNHFRVETIDSFFQSVLRGLARELNLGTSMTIELDQKRVISEGIDLLLRELSADDPTLQWIVSYIGSEIDEGKNWNITNSLKKFARNIHNEVYQQRAGQLRTQLNDTNIISTLRQQLSQERSRALKSIVAQADRFFSELTQHSLSVEDIKGGKKGVCSYFLSLRNERYTTQFGANATHASLSPEAWATAKSPRRAEIVALASSTLMPLLNATEQLRQQEEIAINTCDLVQRHLYQLQLINVIHDRILQLNRDENRFLLADTCHMLSQMQTGDSSFVFEKLGYYIRHIMIDEFQDTSRMQWNNFLHILREGLSGGNESMLVGDVKQAIYRWRGSDWRILNGEVHHELGAYTPHEAHKLSMNRRSMRQIVTFNNHLFSRCNTLLADLLGDAHSAPLLHAYSDVEQEHKDKHEGYVRVADVIHDEGESPSTAMCRQVLNTIQELIASGISEGDIALLMRNNRHIQQIVDYISLHAPYIHIFSSEAYRLDASIATNMLIDTLRWIADSKHSVSLLQVAVNYHRHVLSDDMSMADILVLRAPLYGLPSALVEQRSQLQQHPLYELLEHLYRILQLHLIQGEDGYLLTFFDHISQFCAQQSGGIKELLQYWDTDLKSSAIPSGGADGIEAMTIHKSKGLEFHTVIVPFCEWNLNKYDDILWVSTDNSSYTPLATNPIPYGKKMKLSAFADEYHEEYLQQVVDSYNLLYVALTRPKCNLIILKSKSDSTLKKDTSIANVAQLITCALGTSDTGVLEYGSLSLPTPPNTSTATNTSPNPLEMRPRVLHMSMCSENPTSRFRQSNQSKRFIASSHSETSITLQDTPATPSYIDRGLVLHELFSMINTATDVPGAIARMVRDGLIASTAQSSIERLVQRALAQPQASEWFSGRYELYTECTILYRDEQGMVSHMRPDRVMRDGNRIIVVDFKFARERKEHHQQVSNYMRQLRAMGHAHVEGHLWYMYENRICEVKPQDATSH